MLLCDLKRSEGRVFDVLVLTISFSIFAELHEAVASRFPRLNILHNVDMLNFADDAIDSDKLGANAASAGGGGGGGSGSSRTGSASASTTTTTSTSQRVWLFIKRRI